MRRLLITTCIFMSLFAIWSCEDSNETTIPSGKDYFPLKVGNYWVYQTFRIDTLGNEFLESSKNDTITIVNESIINGYKYYGIRDRHCLLNVNKIIYYRDSSDCIIDLNGKIILSTTNFTDTINIFTDQYFTNKYYTLSRKMEKTEEPITVPCETFYKVINAKQTLISNSKFRHVRNPRYLNSYYAPGVGHIISTYCYLLTPEIYEERLVSYHIEE